MFEQCLYFNTTSLARKLEREWTQAFKSFNLTPPQAFMLRVVLQKQAALQGELASEMNITRSTATRTLGVL
jgi:DNA-binding MarR family transcriptional regulator